jgi:hypothetical protein
MATSEISAMIAENPSPLQQQTNVKPPSKIQMTNSGSFMLHPTETSAVDAPPLPALGHRSFRQKTEHIWNGLPSAAKATLVLAILGTVLLVVYSVVTVSLRSYDEEAHVATVIIVISIFILYAAFDAVIYENTMQLIILIILSKLYWRAID